MRKGRLEEEGEGKHCNFLHQMAPHYWTRIQPPTVSICFTLLQSKPALIATRLFNKFKVVVGCSRNHSRSSARDDTTGDKMEQSGWQARNSGPDTVTGDHTLCSSQRRRGRLESD